MLGPQTPPPACWVPRRPALRRSGQLWRGRRRGKALGAEATRDFATWGSDAYAARSPDPTEWTDAVAGLLAERGGPPD